MMVQQFQKLGGNTKTTKLAVFGGARVFKTKDHFEIGKRNYVALRKNIWKFGLLIAKEHVGGDVHRTVSIDVATGLITLDINKQQKVNYQL
jgi:chemotaxis protein CheD